MQLDITEKSNFFWEILEDDISELQDVYHSSGFIEKGIKISSPGYLPLDRSLVAKKY